ncbi:L-asparagine oxygenase [Streptomyces ruber]|uniref:L-asparagine oxygenase n=2 Tax=Streptomyces TaxID=1883 RepID=A0A918BCL3_9ACTN|nr:TauD/TfdA family dioxygenase [Streptomyces ruber]GGQ59561.1 L-asparagine oxygenase [Streptomyces ruber]
MELGAAPARALDQRTTRELTTTARTLLTDHDHEHAHEHDDPAAHRELLSAVRRAAPALSDRTHHACRPVDTRDGLYVLKGLPVDDTALGPTPGHWSAAGAAGALHDVVLLLLSALMGAPLAWEGQQDGRFVHNIVPSPGHERAQTGASSATLLSPHTEDAFHPDRAHLLVLGCLRNHDRVATTAASVRRARLADADVELLSRPLLPILPDAAYTGARAHAGEPPAVATLWRTADGPRLRYDPAYTPLHRAAPAHRAAYRRLADELARVSVAVPLAPGDVLVLDNDLVVHGRVPFRARYDGTDRWLKRTSVRVPGRRTRPAAERHEHGYGQRTVEALA